MPTDFWGIVGATIPGILVALIGYWLSIWQDARADRRISLRARELVALEITANLGALTEHWRTINALDKEQSSETEAHIRGMAENGLLSYDLPEWSTTRWENLPSQALASITRKQALECDAFYRNLGRIKEMYARFYTIDDDEKKEYNTSSSTARFWAGRFAGYRVNLYERLRETVQHVVDADNPLGK